jgi:TfoX/Sxy family transcriptional regulator of competence genes
MGGYRIRFAVCACPCLSVSVSNGMAYDESLADRVRDLLAPRSDLSERKMFGGIAFMIGGNMAVGVIEDDLMVRLDPADAERALAEPHARPMDFTGRPMKGMVFVDATGTSTDDDLAGWVDAGADFAASLPPK